MDCKRRAVQSSMAKPSEMVGKILILQVEITAYVQGEYSACSQDWLDVRPDVCSLVKL